MVSDPKRCCPSARRSNFRGRAQSVIIIGTVKLGPLSEKQRFIVWATLCVAALPVLYPMPAHYVWNGDGWNRTTYHGRNDNRTFLWDYDFFGNTRPDLLRTITETIFVLAMGMGLVFCLRSQGARSAETSESGVRHPLSESAPEPKVGLWIMDDALEMLKKSSLWSAENLEAKLVMTADESGEKRYETPEHLAVQILQWFKFRFFDVWEATGGKGSPFDAIDLTGSDSSKQMERVTCWLTIKGIESALGESAKVFGDGAPFQVTTPHQQSKETKCRCVHLGSTAIPAAHALGQSPEQARSHSTK